MRSEHPPLQEVLWSDALSNPTLLHTNPPRSAPARLAGPLLRWAQAVVPRRQWPRTPVFMCATAGLRKLPEHQQEVLMDNVRRQLRRSPFRCGRCCSSCHSTSLLQPCAPAEF